MKQKHIDDELLMKKHVNQLLTGCEELKKELDSLKVLGKDFEKEYTTLLKKLPLPKKRGEDFLAWVKRNIVPSKEEDSPFQIIKK